MSIRPSRILLGLLFANGMYRKHYQLQHTTIPVPIQTPLMYGMIVLFSGFNHTWLFPFHLYNDYCDGRYGGNFRFRSDIMVLYD
jgi:hypothetical protein